MLEIFIFIKNEFIQHLNINFHLSLASFDDSALNTLPVYVYTLYMRAVIVSDPKWILF